MMRTAFIKKLDDYSTAMQEKIMNPKKYEILKLNIDALRNKLMKKRKIRIMK